MSDDILWDSSSWIPNTLLDAPVFRGNYHHCVSQTVCEDQARDSTVIAASVEEKVSDLIRSYPDLKVFLKSCPKDPDARIRDLTISTSDRDQLLHEIIAARRQEPHTSARPERRSMSPPRSPMRLTATDRDARDGRNDGPKGIS